MAGITLAQAESQLALYLAAEESILLNQSYEISGRKLTRANLAEVHQGIKTWNERVKDLSEKSSGRNRSLTVRPGW